MNKSIIKYSTLFISIISVILGIIVVCNVIPATTVLNYILVIALGLFGIAKICAYASAPKPSVWDLVLGILFLIVSIFLIANNTALENSVVIGYVLGFLAIIGSIAHFMVAYEIRKHFKDAPISGEIISGIIYLLLGLCFIILPVFAEITYVYIVGIFMIVAGIVGAITALTIKTRLKK